MMLFSFFPGRNEHHNSQYYIKGKWGYNGTRRVRWLNDIEAQHRREDFYCTFTNPKRDDDPQGEVCKTDQGK